VREGRVRVDVKDGDRVSTLLHALLVQDVRDEVHAGGAEKRRTRGASQMSDVPHRNVAHHVLAIVDDGHACQSFIIHESKRFR
jgi:hypothetical protein